MEKAAATALTGLNRRPPSPKAGLFGSHLSRMRRDPLGLLTDAARDCGDIALLRLLFPAYLLTNPDHVARVFDGSGYKQFEKGRLYDVIRPLIGYGLLSSDGDFWRKQRKRAQPAFSHDRLAAYATAMTGAASAMLDRWQRQASSGDPFDVSAEMMRLTLRIVGLTLFSTDLEDSASLVGQALPSVLSILNKRTARHPVFWYLPTVQNFRLKRAIGRLDRLVQEIIAERRRKFDLPQELRPVHDDLLEIFVTARDDEGVGMTDRQLRDEVMTMVLAGHETTSNALSWTLHLLTRHPEIEARLVEEVDRALGGRLPTMRDIMPADRHGSAPLDYVRMVVKEAMRLYPPIWLMGRRVAGDDEIGGYRIPAGTIVFVSPWVSHRRPQDWEDPERFDAERFAPQREKARHKYAYFPFAAGPRRCMGDEFSLMESMLILSMIVQRYRLRRVVEAEILPMPMMTLRPKGGVPLAIAGRR